MRKIAAQLFIALDGVVEAAGGEDAPFARALGDARKIVASRGRPDLTRRNSERITRSLAEAVTAPKGEPDAGRVWISGSVSVVRHLPAAGLPHHDVPQ
ncbi:hypothetical protein ABZ667_30015 [Streptomyces lavendulae]|uniref:hypothetical protein n=1 Tax=Streptomyces lavendulae TaxID=1914 RepID=UPI0033E65F41